MTELYVLGAAAALVVGVSFWRVRTTTLQLSAARELHPTRVHAGTDSRVDLAVRNRSSKRTPVLAVRDPFDHGRRVARFLLAPLRPGEVARAAYRLPTQRRGGYAIGPLEASATDAFGVATRSTNLAPPTSLTV